MKITFILIVATTLTTLASVSYSQSARVSLTLKNVTVKDALKAIETKSEFFFIYNNELIDVTRRVNINANEQRIDEILNNLFAGQNIDIDVIDRKIVLAPSDIAAAVQQQRGVSGRVTDRAGAPLPGVTVVVKGTTQGTITNADGNYSIGNVPPNAMLVFSFVGMRTQEVVVGNQSIINVSMQEETFGIEEVVAIGYGVVRKSDLTGAVSVVNVSDMGKTNSGTIANQLQGLATGVNVRGTGRAGSDGFIEIRGVGTLSNRTPLWVIDGMIANPGADFNPSDIESIQILKDASTAAIYGSRAANGVIIVTTKQGREGPLKVNVNIKESWDWSPRFPLMNANDYKFYNDLAYDEGIKDKVWTSTKQNHWNNDTDWQDAVLRTALVQDYNLSLSGGSSYAKYLISAGYHKNEGVTYGNSFDRYTFRVNSEGKRGRLKFGENLFFTNTNTDPLQTNPYNDFLRMLPTIPIYDSNNLGGYGYGSEANARTFGTNPIAREDLEDQNILQHRVNGVFWAEAEIFSWLTYKLNTGIDYFWYQRNWFRGLGNWTLNQEYRDPESQKQMIHTYNKLIENTLNLNYEINKHKVDAFAGITYQTFLSESLYGARLRFPKVGDEYLRVLDAGQANQTNSNNIQQNALISYLGRFNYNFDNKYYLTATIRRDGSSRLSINNRWDNFPSIAGSWRISREKFFKIPWIDDLKIRANWGKLGIADIGNWQYLGTINQTIVTVFGPNQALQSGATQVRIVNENLRWETKKTYNVGFDVAFLNQRLGASIDYFDATTLDVLTGMPIALATGNEGGAPLANAASLKNNGFEITLNWRDEISDFKYNITANFTTLKNKVLELGYGKDVYYTSSTKSTVGEPLSMFYLLKTDGLFRTQQEIDNYITSKGVPITINGKRPQLGDVKYIDTDDNGQITQNDRQIVGNPWPWLQASFTFFSSWRNFDFSMMWNGQFGNDVYNVALWQGRYFADNSNYFVFRKGEEPYQVNPNSSFPRIIYNDVRNTQTSDRYLEDGSYIRMKNIQLGYKLSNAMLNKIGVDAVRVYLSGNNLITITSYRGLDPDFINTDVWNRGTDSFAFPNTRSFMTGLDITF